MQGLTGRVICSQLQIITWQQFKREVMTVYAVAGQPSAS